VSVEEACIKTWWHLILTLGPSRYAYFNQVGVVLGPGGSRIVCDWLCVVCNLQVCIPFLMLCLGLDPKSDLSQLPSLFEESGSIPGSYKPVQDRDKPVEDTATFTSGHSNGVADQDTVFTSGQTNGVADQDNTSGIAATVT